MSLQLDRYLSARRQGRNMLTACVESGIDASEARLIEADIAGDPTMLAEPTPSPPPAPDPAHHQENEAMPRAKKTEQVQEVHAPDFALAVRIFRQDIKPAQAKVGEFAQEQSEAYKQIKKRAYIQPQAARLAFRLDGMEESKRDDFLRSFNGLLKEMNIFMPVDLADIAEGKGAAAENVVPLGTATKPKLATIPLSDGVDADLAGDDLPEAAEEGHDPDAGTADEDHAHEQAAE